MIQPTPPFRPAAPPRPAEDDGRADLEAQIRQVESLRDLTGNKAKFDPTLVKMKALLKTMDGKPFEMSEEQRSRVDAYLHANGPLPEDLGGEHKAELEDFKALVGHGMRFGTMSGQDLGAMAAYEQLVRYKWHGMENQVMIKTWQDGNIHLRTVRPGDLHELRGTLERYLTKPGGIQELEDGSIVIGGLVLARGE